MYDIIELNNKLVGDLKEIAKELNMHPVTIRNKLRDLKRMPSEEFKRLFIDTFDLMLSNINNGEKKS